MSPDYMPGDRILCSHPDLIETVRGREATVTHVAGASIYAMVDNVVNPDGGYSFSYRHIERISKEPTEEEIANLFGLKREIHFLHPEARDMSFDGCSALCDWMNQLEDAPRTHTESSALPEEVTCQDCLNFMSRLAYVWIDGGDDHRDYHRGATTKVPRNPYWGDGNQEGS